VCVNSARAAAVWACEPFLYRGGGERERCVCVCESELGAGGVRGSGVGAAPRVKGALQLLAK